MSEKSETETQHDEPAPPLWVMVTKTAFRNGPKYVIIGFLMMYLVEQGVPIWGAALFGLLAPAVGTLFIVGFVAAMGIVLIEIVEHTTPDATELEGTNLPGGPGDRDE